VAGVHSRQGGSSTVEVAALLLRMHLLVTLDSSGVDKKTLRHGSQLHECASHLDMLATCAAVFTDRSHMTHDMSWPAVLQSFKIVPKSEMCGAPSGSCSYTVR
jgi:hypothetical protein